MFLLRSRPLSFYHPGFPSFSPAPIVFPYFPSFPLIDYASRSLSTSIKVPIDLIKELRLRTKAGVQDCRFALIENDLCIEKSILWIQSQAKNIAHKKSGRIASEGLLSVVSNKQRTQCTILELSCETDFASRSPSFGLFGIELARKALDLGIQDTKQMIESNGTIDKIEQMAYTLKENVVLRHLYLFQSDLLGIYMHQRMNKEMNVMPNDEGYLYWIGARMGLAQFSIKGCPIAALEDIREKFQPFADKIATQVFCMNPSYVSREMVTGEVDPEEILMEQECYDQPNETVAMALSKKIDQIQKEYPSVQIKLEACQSTKCGEGIEKKESLLGDEVCKLLESKQ